MDLGFLGVLLALSAKSWEWGAPGPPWDHPLKIKSFIFLGLGDLGDLGDLGTVALSRSPGRICAPSSLQKLREAAQSSPNPQRATRAPLPLLGLLQEPGQAGGGGGLQLLPTAKKNLGLPLPGAGPASGHSATPERFSSSQFV